MRCLRASFYKHPVKFFSLSSLGLLVLACGTPSDSVPDTCGDGGCTAGTGGQATGGVVSTSTGGTGAGADSSMGSGGTPAGGTGGLDTGGGTFSTKVTLEEGQPGQCAVDGIIESANAGFTGTGYLNTDNSVGASIEWAVAVGEAGSYTIEIAYASEPTGDRPGDLLVGDAVVAAGVSFPSTSSWTTYSTVTVEAVLAAGENRITLSSTQEMGLGNIDSLTITGAAVSAFDCGAVVGTGGQGTGGDPATGGAGTGGQASGGASTGGQGTGGENDDRCDIGVWNGNPPQILGLSGALGTHDPAVIEANGVLYRYDTGNNIPTFKSNNLTTWSNAGGVYNGSNYPPTWLVSFRNQHGWKNSDNGGPWAPDVIYFGGKYHMYSSNSLFFGRNISCISHLTTTDIAAGNWQDQGTIICTNGTENFNAIDPEVELDEDGTPWMAFGSFWSKAIQLIKLDESGNRDGNEIHHVAHASSIEGPTLVRRCGYYYLLVTHGLCCPNETEAARSINNIDYRTVVGRSQNILGPYVDKSGKAMTAGGGTILVQGKNSSGVNSPYAAAGHGDVFISGNKFYHAYHAYPYSRNPYAELRIVEMPFDEQGWPVAAATP